VAVGRALGVVASDGPDELADLVLHRLRQHREPGADGEREQPLLGMPGDLGERDLHLLGQSALGGVRGRDDLNGR
jgi:hypothetical protein